jgi:hypothetical protein
VIYQQTRATGLAAADDGRSQENPRLRAAIEVPGASSTVLIKFEEEKTRASSSVSCFFFFSEQ